MLRCTFSLFLLLVSSCLYARDIVVDQKSKSASDDNVGTAEQPLKTIFAAAGKAHAGDKVIIHAGEYRETVIILSSGTAEAPIVFENAPGENVIIKGSDTITNWTSDDGSVWKTKLRVPPPRGPSGKFPAFWETNDVRQVFTRDGEMLDAQVLHRVMERPAMKAGTFFCDPKASMLYVWLQDSGSPAQHPPEVSVRGAWLIIQANHIVIRGLQMRHASTTALANWPACDLQGDDVTLENCKISWGDFVGVSMNGSGNTLRNCTVACHGDSGIGGKGEHHTIEGCRVVYNNIARYSPEWHAGGAKLIPDFRHGSVRHNEFAYNLGPGLWLDAGCDENIIDGNVAHDNEGTGVMVEVSKGNLVMNNICYANRNYLSGLYLDGKGIAQETNWSEQRVGPSRLLKPYHAGQGRGIYISSAPETKVLNNTIYLNEGEGICVEGPPRALRDEMMQTRGETVMNNISVFNKGSQLTFRAEKNGEQSTTSDHNVLFATGAVLAKYGWDGNSAAALPDWQRISGQDAQSVDADPRFAMAIMDDFRVLPNSPAVHAAIPVSAVDHDFFGRPRDPEKPTIGACEQPAQGFPEPIWSSLSEVIRSGHR
jgi:parallel beta-helix repeat protein